MKKILSLLLVANFAFAGVTLGKDYKIVSGSLPSKQDGKVTVTEFYSYGCVHCAHLEPLIDDWGNKNSKVAVVNHIQVVWGDYYKDLAKINATAEALKLGAKFHQAAFDATMNQHQNLEKPDVLKAFLEKNKNIVDPSKFMNVYNSFSISAIPAKYANLTKEYDVNGTPTVVVGDKYKLEPATPDRIVEVVDELVKKAAKEK